MQSPDLKSKLEASGIDTATSTPEQFSELIRVETVRYAKIVKDAGIKLDESALAAIAMAGVRSK